jgi:hypothetical protein
LFYASSVLVREDIAIGIPILLRSAIEAYVDLENLAKDRLYGNYLRAAELREWIKILDEAKSENNAYLTGLTGDGNMDHSRSQWKSELDKLKQNGYRPLQNNTKFIKANLCMEYKSVYYDLCCHSHNNLRTLQSRHLIYSVDEKDFNVEYHYPIDLNLLPYLDSFCGILLLSTETIHRVLDTRVEGIIQKLKQDLTLLRTQIKIESVLPRPFSSLCTPCKIVRHNVDRSKDD